MAFPAMSPDCFTVKVLKPVAPISYQRATEPTPEEAATFCADQREPLFHTALSSRKSPVSIGTLELACAASGGRLKGETGKSASLKRSVPELGIANTLSAELGFPEKLAEMRNSVSEVP